jgi:broad specificity phosphatase PhoE
MARLLFITHPEVVIDPAVPVPRWRLNQAGTQRMRAFADSAEAARVAAVWASTEAKAIEGAGILAAGRGIGVSVDPALGENDRSATGFLPPPEFERAADAFFGAPEESFCGWERAVDAQARIRAAVERIASTHTGGGDLAIVSHGAVGTLMLLHLRRAPIDRSADQPFAGHYWTASLPELGLIDGWRPIAPRA